MQSSSSYELYSLLKSHQALWNHFFTVNMTLKDFYMSLTWMDHSLTHESQYDTSGFPHNTKNTPQRKRHFLNVRWNLDKLYFLFSKIFYPPFSPFCCFLKGPSHALLGFVNFHKMKSHGRLAELRMLPLKSHFILIFSEKKLLHFLEVFTWVCYVLPWINNNLNILPLCF